MKRSIIPITPTSRSLITSMIAISFLIITTSHSDAQIKTYQLDEITIHSLPLEKFSEGSRILHLDSLQKMQYNQGNLSDLLLQNSTIYFKEYGNNMVSSPSIRGTGAQRTAVMWHGINLNSLTLGQSDFSTYPVFLFDDISVQYGGSSALYGSDAIGGAILLQTTPSWKPGIGIQLHQGFGSFCRYFSGIKVGVGSKKFESVTKLFRFSLKNDFPYIITDRMGNEAEVIQENASVLNYGILQEFNYRFTEKTHLSIQGWYENNYHQIQPLMVSTPDAPQPGDDLLDKNLRLVADYKHFARKGMFTGTLAYVWDYQLYNSADIIETKRVISTAGYESDLTAKTLLRAGGEASFISPEVHAYTDGADEWRESVYLSVRQIVGMDWSLTGNIRKAFVPFAETPVAPSVAVNYAHHFTSSLLALRFLADRSFRVPTFNDRYWRDQGRKDLKSEDGYNLETGFNFELEGERHKFTSDLSAYWMLIDNWITWQPDRFLSDRDGDGVTEPVYDWRPFNLKKVEGSGVELMLRYDLSVNGLDLGIHTQYALNRAILKESDREDDPSLGQQLPYTPAQRYTIGVNTAIKGYFANLINYYIGKRTGQDVINEVYPGYSLLNLTFGKNFHIKGPHALSGSFSINNLFDTRYQNVNKRAMPGRNYLLSIKYFLTN